MLTAIESIILDFTTDRYINASMSDMQGSSTSPVDENIPTIIIICVVRHDFLLGLCSCSVLSVPVVGNENDMYQFLRSELRRQRLVSCPLELTAITNCADFHLMRAFPCLSRLFIVNTKLSLPS